jgi:hypothetical protein
MEHNVLQQTIVIRSPHLVSIFHMALKFILKRPFPQTATFAWAITLIVVAQYDQLYLTFLWA